MHAYRLTNALARRGHRVTVVHSEDAYRALGGAEPGGTFPHEPGVTLRPLRTSCPVARRDRDLPQRAARASTARQLDDALGGDRFDVVHFHNVSLAAGRACSRYGDGVKLYTTSEHWLVCPMHVLFRDNREPCVEPHCLRCTLAFGRPPQLWRYTGLLEQAVPHVDLFLAPSRFTLEAHRDARLHGADAPPAALPAGQRRRARRAERARAAVLPLRRTARAAEGRARADRGVPLATASADLLIVGDGEQRAELERQAAGLDHVRFLGRVHPSELPPLYAGATALLVPSVGYEVFGLVLLEAFAQRTPAIVHDLGALPEVVGEAGGGLVYRTTGELVDALEALQADPARRGRARRRGPRGAGAACGSEERAPRRVLRRRSSEAARPDARGTRVS